MRFHDQGLFLTLGILGQPAEDRDALWKRSAVGAPAVPGPREKGLGKTVSGLLGWRYAGRLPIPQRGGRWGQGGSAGTPGKALAGTGLNGQTGHDGSTGDIGNEGTGGQPG
jgi:hypothetical protein